VLITVLEGIVLTVEKGDHLETSRLFEEGEENRLARVRKKESAIIGLKGAGAQGDPTLWRGDIDSV